jgi:hypothetical protein
LVPFLQLDNNSSEINEIISMNLVDLNVTSI